MPRFRIHLCCTMSTPATSRSISGWSVGYPGCWISPRVWEEGEEGSSLHFKSWKHILRAPLLSVLQFPRKTQLRKDFGRNPKLTFACLFQVMHMHACKTQALVVSASGLKAMAWTEIEAHLYKIAFKNSICQLHTLQRCRAWVAVRRWGCQPGTWAISSASRQLCSLSLGHFSFPSLFSLFWNSGRLMLSIYLHLKIVLNRDMSFVTRRLTQHMPKYPKFLGMDLYVCYVQEI